MIILVTIAWCDVRTLYIYIHCTTWEKHVGRICVTDVIFETTTPPLNFTRYKIFTKATPFEKAIIVDCARRLLPQHSVVGMMGDGDNDSVPMLVGALKPQPGDDWTPQWRLLMARYDQLGIRDQIRDGAEEVEGTDSPFGGFIVVQTVLSKRLWDHLVFHTVPSSYLRTAVRQTGIIFRSTLRVTVLLYHICTV